MTVHLCNLVYFIVSILKTRCLEKSWRKGPRCLNAPSAGDGAPSRAPHERGPYTCLPPRACEEHDGPHGHAAPRPARRRASSCASARECTGTNGSAGQSTPGIFNGLVQHLLIPPGDAGLCPHQPPEPRAPTLRPATGPRKNGFSLPAPAPPTERDSLILLSHRGCRRQRASEGAVLPCSLSAAAVGGIGVRRSRCPEALASY